VRQLSLLMLLACGDARDPESSATLADYGLLGFEGDAPVYAEGAFPYSLATPLFSDYAVKERAIVLPDGEAAAWVEGDQVLDLPVGTHILKTFSMPADLRAPEQDLQRLETRVLTRRADRWEAEPWLWDEATGEATLAPAGAALTLEVTGLEGEPLTIHYLVPQRNQCLDCHELKGEDDRYLVPIGPKVRHLNFQPDDRGNQLERMAAEGHLTGLPETATLEAATVRASELEPELLDDAALDAAARDYLDINCAHCHNPAGTEGVSSQLFLHREESDPFHLGVCKRPGSAGAGTGGRTFDIVPGDHQQSILWYRMQTEETGAMMPDIGRSVAHGSGVDLIAAWIDRMDGSCN
jgi:uncharacterized repeat protein (TIGR03806 family)